MLDYMPILVLDIFWIYNLSFLVVIVGKFWRAIASLLDNHWIYTIRGGEFQNINESGDMNLEQLDGISQQRWDNQTIRGSVCLMKTEVTVVVQPLQSLPLSQWQGPQVHQRWRFPGQVRPSSWHHTIQYRIIDCNISSSLQYNIVWH